MPKEPRQPQQPQPPRQPHRPQATSRARLVLTALFVDRQSPAEIAERYGVHRSWVYKLKARYEAEGQAAFEPRSRRPKTSPNATPSATIGLILLIREQLVEKGLDADAETIAWHLTHHHQVEVSRPTIHRILVKAGVVVPEPKKRPKSSYLRFEASMPNECWQSDFTHYRLLTGVDTEILTWLDDCSRRALHCRAHARITVTIVKDAFLQTGARYGFPASTLTDNGMVYTVRFSGGKGGRNTFEQELHDRQIVQKNSRPNHPQTCGKVERFQLTMKKWLAAQPVQPATIAELQALLEAFVEEYNTRRPHRSLPHRSTPGTYYDSMPKAAPGQVLDPESHERIRHDTISKSGTLTLRYNSRLHHIGVGRTYARTRVILIVHDLDIRIVNAATGELLRELVLDPTRDYQPTGTPTRPTPKPHKQ